MLVGASRKSFIGHYLHENQPEQRVFGTLGVHLASVIKGADILRVHDVQAHKQALEMFTKII